MCQILHELNYDLYSLRQLKRDLLNFFSLKSAVAQLSKISAPSKLNMGARHSRVLSRFLHDVQQWSNAQLLFQHIQSSNIFTTNE